MDFISGSGIITMLRKYPHGSRIRMHVDEVESEHVLGAILQVDQNSTTPWGLQLIDHSGIHQTVHTFPGDMILFESASIFHGRPAVFRGNYYINAFFYFQPSNWTFNEIDATGKMLMICQNIMIIWL